MRDDRNVTLTGATVLLRSGEVLWRAAPGYLVLATLDDQVRRAEGPAPEVWTLLDRPVTLDELTATLAARHAASADTVRADLEPFLADLLAAGFVHEVDALQQRADG